MVYPPKSNSKVYLLSLSILILHLGTFWLTFIHLKSKNELVEFFPPAFFLRQIYNNAVTQTIPYHFIIFPTLLLMCYPGDVENVKIQRAQG